MRTKKEIPTIPFGNKYSIGLDGMNVTAFKRGNPRKAGEKGAWRPIGYYSTFQNALDALIDHDVKQPDLKDLKDVVRRQDELHRLIDNLSIPPDLLRRPPPERKECEKQPRKSQGHIKPPAKRKKALKPQRKARDIVSKKAVVRMLNETKK